MLFKRAKRFISNINNGNYKYRAVGTGMPGPNKLKASEVLRRFLSRNRRFTGFLNLFERCYLHRFIKSAEQSNYVFLLSYPRSGSHWVRYIIESITGHPTLGDQGKLKVESLSFFYADKPIYKRVPIAVKSNVPIAIKRHQINIHDSKAQKVLFLVRNPIKAIISHVHHRLKNDFKNDINNQIEMFANNCFEMNEWPAPVKIIYLEDILSTKESEIKLSISSLLEFIEVEEYESALSNFMSFINQHKLRSLKALTRNPVSKKIDWEDDIVCLASNQIEAELVVVSEKSKILREILSKYSLGSINEC